MTSQATSCESAFMHEALTLARQSRPSPNPRVGAVIVNRGQIVGRGFHEAPGLPHAEVNAIADTDPDSLSNSVLYVTLEPCCHYGKTAPCVDAILAAGISRVSIAMLDPDPRVNGNGARHLRQAGLTVDIGLCGKDAAELLESYIHHRTTNRPLIRLKAAITLDGYLATVTGDSKWISSKQSRRRAHAMRAEADAVLVGLETVLRDDPMLDVRHVNGPNPLRIVLDSRLRTPPSSKLIETAKKSPLLLAHTIPVEGDSIGVFSNLPGVETLPCHADDNGRVDLQDFVARLSKRGVLSLLVEGGGVVHGAFARAGLADRLALFIAPKILGSGKPWINFAGVSSITAGLTLTNQTVSQIGTDLLIEGCLSPGSD